MDKEMLKGYIDIILLCLLIDGPLYGYELAKKGREVSDNLLELKEATLYMALKRLEKQEMLTSYWGDPAEGSGGRRKYYQLTDKGLAHLERGKKEWILFRAMMDQFMKGASV